MLGKVLRYYYTIKPLKLKQVFYQIIHLLKVSDRLAKSTKKPSTFLLRAHTNNFVPFIPRIQSIISPDTFRIFDHTIKIIHPEDWLKENIEPLFRYNLHYFDGLIAESDVSRTEWHVALLKKWVDGNPIGTVGWDPYPISRRIMNTIKWVYSGHKIPNFWGLSLLHQAMVLNRSIEWRLMANHLWENAQAMVAAGLFFDGTEADRLYRKGYAILDNEIREQVGCDGGHFERSPMYHSILLEGLLDLRNIFRVYDRAFPENWQIVIEKMINWLKIINHPNGEIPFFNDATLGVAPTLRELLGYAEKQDIKLENNRPPFIDLTDSGFFVKDSERYHFVADTGTIGPSFQPGHAHSEELSFEFSVDGQKVVCNPGISTYMPGPVRNQERGASSHNCLVLDDKNPSEIWSAHRVAKRAQVRHNVETDSNRVILTASHNGYKPVVHTRTFVLEDDRILVEDNIKSNSIHTVNVYYHLHPDVTIRETNGDHLDLIGKKGMVLGTFFVSDHNSFIIEKAYHHPGYNLNKENVRIMVSIEGLSFLSLRSEFRIQD